MHGAIKERLQYLTSPKDLSDWQLGAYFTFTQHDIDIIQRYRRDYKPTRICSTSMCATVFGRRYPDVKIIPESILQYVAKQIKADPKEYNRYSQREAAKYKQLEEERFVKNRMSFTSLIF